MPRRPNFMIVITNRPEMLVLEEDGASLGLVQPKDETGRDREIHVSGVEVENVRMERPLDRKT